MKKFKIIVLTILVTIAMSMGNVLSAVQTEMQFGELILTFTYKYDLRYNDRGSGAGQDGGFWHPIPPEGFHALGSIGLPNYSDPNGVQASICVKAAPGSNAPLAPPTDMKWLWDDRGSGAHMDGSCWRPVVPEGYVALGDVIAKGHGKPWTGDVMCVRKDLTIRGEIGNEIWSDAGSGGKYDFISYQIIAPSSFIDAEKGVFAVNSIVGNGSHSRPDPGCPVINCLELPFPVEKFNDPTAPVLKGYTQPPQTTGTTIDRIVYVPFTAVKDDFKSLQWKVDNSPFYKIERQVSYRLELFDHNQTSTPQTVTKTVKTGVSKSSSSTFSLTTGISVTAESGVSFLGSGGKVSATVSIELGWSTTTGIEQFEEESIERSLTAPPQKAAALWVISYVLYIQRADQSYLSNNLPFNVDSFVHAQYPDNN